MLQLTGYRLQFMGLQLKVYGSQDTVHCGLQATAHRAVAHRAVAHRAVAPMATAHFISQVTAHRLQFTGYRIQLTGYRL